MVLGVLKDAFLGKIDDSSLLLGMQPEKRRSEKEVKHYCDGEARRFLRLRDQAKEACSKTTGAAWFEQAAEQHVNQAKYLLYFYKSDNTKRNDATISEMAVTRFTRFLHVNTTEESDLWKKVKDAILSDEIAKSFFGPIDTKMFWATAHREREAQKQEVEAESIAKAQEEQRKRMSPVALAALYDTLHKNIPQMMHRFLTQDHSSMHPADVTQCAVALKLNYGDVSRAIKALIDDYVNVYTLTGKVQSSFTAENYPEIGTPIYEKWKADFDRKF